MTAGVATVPGYMSSRCDAGQHNRCTGFHHRRSCTCTCRHPAAGNLGTALVVAVQMRDHADGRLLLDMLGLVDGPRGRDILPDDTRSNSLEKVGKPPGKNADEPPVRRESGEPVGRRCTAPAGLYAVPTAAATPAPTSKRPTVVAPPAATHQPADPEHTATTAEITRLVDAGVTPSVAATVAPPAARQRRRRTWTDEEAADAVRQLTGAHLTVTEIAAVLNLSTRAVRRHQRAGAR